MRIEDCALVDGTHTSAPSARSGSADWICVPRFDSAAGLSALLGGPALGRALVGAPRARRTS